MGEEVNQPGPSLPTSGLRARLVGGWTEQLNWDWAAEICWLQSGKGAVSWDPLAFSGDTVLAPAQVLGQDECTGADEDREELCGAPGPRSLGSTTPGVWGQSVNLSRLQGCLQLNSTGHTWPVHLRAVERVP